MTGSVYSYNCDDLATTGPYGASQSVNQGTHQSLIPKQKEEMLTWLLFKGCAATAPGPYGSLFNSNNGGTIAMEWTSSSIKMWNFSPSQVPQNIKSGQPDPSTWEIPHFTTAGGSCVIDDHFRNHNIVFDITFCGNYAGQDYFWRQTSCYKDNPGKWPRCIDYVAANPGAFENAYWVVNSVKVYQWQ